LTPKEYFLVTAHRQENVDEKETLESILNGLELVHNEFSLPIIYPIHPRTSKRLKEFGLKVNGVDFINPLGYLEFLQLEANAKLVLTDSGGIQEEACILGVPCVTLRDNTERPETVEVGSNILAGTNRESILKGVRKMSNRQTLKKFDQNASLNGKNPFGDGTAGKRVIKILERVI
ncbi:MAG: UDP-N-acetylglucosamine 2-epimerase, partial [Candidatus Cloacimonetes bacterium]|nr:UDP-N-acetylglucosamine 2-epimerase [Candidatus Cloacimonadota bacterium]